MGIAGVGVFPEGEEVFVGGEGTPAGGIFVRTLRGSRLQGVRTRYAETRRRARPAVPDDAAMVENFLELGGGLRALSSRRLPS